MSVREKNLKFLLTEPTMDMLSPCCFILAISWPSGWLEGGGEPLAAVRWVAQGTGSVRLCKSLGLTMAANVSNV